MTVVWGLVILSGLIAMRLAWRFNSEIKEAGGVFVFIRQSFRFRSDVKFFALCLGVFEVCVLLIVAKRLGVY